ncbi:Bug family tripartite tricarboxylate transporter substrate binding protein [Halomonas dongshanensis]|uniref:Tripartite tricarboxylate transporter substrate binding protein n=1 Tax=Halomonas dongshanensis TaxID=2890835 RepID=A0ABT2EEC8_9GAMM|nr:tripartite tricarboxylate transporter substrate binding protein [Halomonas dongshanensis]MCS2609938.1 tripartite tricarboxylate transporter substrate binding protein [Halomonas dongshanensis]
MTALHSSFGILVATALIAPAAAMADYPDRAIELIIPFGQGGGNDLVGRAFSQSLSEYAGVDVLPVNRTGGSGAVGFHAASSARPDGYNIAMINSSLVGNPHIINGFPASIDDFTPICLLSAEPVGIVVSADSEIETLADWVAIAQEDPDRLALGYTSIGELIALSAGNVTDTDPTLIPYSGSGDAITAVIGGHVDGAVVSDAEAYSQVQADQIRMLAFFSEERSQSLPNVPTSAEEGYPLDIGLFRAIGAPANLPEEVENYLVDACTHIAEDETFNERMNRIGFNVQLRTGDDFKQWLARQNDAFAAAADLLKQ